jgi:hypothetical protein
MTKRIRATHHSHDQARDPAGAFSAGEGDERAATTCTYPECDCAISVVGAAVPETACLRLANRPDLVEIKAKPMDAETERARRAILALIEMAQLNFPSSSDEIVISVGGRHSASIEVGWSELRRLIER